MGRRVFYSLNANGAALLSVFANENS